MNERKLLVKFNKYCGRMGSLNGLFICTPAERESVIGVNTHFGEVLGKHSDIDEVLEEKDLKILSEDQEKISWLLELTGSTVSGINPLDYHEDDDDDDDD